MNVTSFSKKKGCLLIFCYLFLLIGTSKANTANYFGDPVEPLSSSFELVRGIILVQAELDGELANFILDTGSPMIILNGQVTKSSEMQANTLHGSLSGEWKTIAKISWAGVQKFNIEALTLDISHLEYLTEKPIKGLIGYEFFGNYDLMLDFENEIVTLVPPNYAAITGKWKLKAELPFSLEGHIPVIEARIGDVKVRLGLDTGSGTNLLDVNRKNEIAPEFLAPIENAMVVGLGSNAQEIDAADVLETTVAEIKYWNMRYIFSDISGLTNLKENKVDGLLGYPFFESGKFTINYGRKVIGFWEY